MRMPFSSSMAAALTNPSTAPFAADALAKFFCGSCDRAPVISVNEPFGLVLVSQ